MQHLGSSLRPGTAIYVQSARLLFVAALAITMGEHASHATDLGPTSSGGGFALVCPQSQSTELLDFYEARLATVAPQPGQSEPNFEQYLELALERMEKTAYGFQGGTTGRRFGPREVASWILQRRNFVPADQMPRIDDSRIQFTIPAGCTLRQAAAYLDDQNIFFDQDIWTSLSPRAQAGLVVHEVVYWFERKLALARDSRRARRTTALLFDSSFQMDDVYATEHLQALAVQAYVCISGVAVDGDPTVAMSLQTSFNIFQVINHDLQTQMMFQFYWLGGEPALTRQTATATPTFIDGFWVFDFDLAPQPDERVHVRMRVRDLPSGTREAFVSGTKSGPLAREIAETPIRCYIP